VRGGTSGWTGNGVCGEGGREREREKEREREREREKRREEREIGRSTSGPTTCNRGKRRE